MILNTERELLVNGIKWYTLSLENFKTALPLIIEEGEYYDDPLANTRCAQKYSEALLSCLHGESFEIFKEESDAYWLNSDEILALFRKDAIYIMTCFPNYKSIANIHGMNNGEIILEF